MIKPPLPSNEAERLETLRSLELLDTGPEERFDRYTRMARRLFGVPIALVSNIGTTRLVAIGDSLPPRYQVQAITADGVVLTNLRNGETLWLPISAPMTEYSI